MQIKVIVYEAKYILQIMRINCTLNEWKNVIFCELFIRKQTIETENKFQIMNANYNYIIITENVRNQFKSNRK